jgi:hypothetical protein
MNASGDAILLFMPVDMQDPPSMLPSMLRQWEIGYEIVYGIKSQREENFLTKSIRNIYYKLLSKLTYVDYPANVADFQLIDKKVLNLQR